jgi:beta-lactamase class A
MPAENHPLPAIPDTPVGRELTWVLSAMAAKPSEADLALHFSEPFLSAVPPSKIVAIFTQTAQAAPFTVEKVFPGPRAESLVAVVRSTKGPRIRISIGVGSGNSPRIEGLLLRPAIDAIVAKSWDEVQSNVRSVAPRTNMLAAEIDVDGKEFTPLASIEPTLQLALGSTFKLYILDALATQVAAGTRAWDDAIAIVDALKSLPSGEMRNDPAGKTYPVRTMAEQMISVSDNTATDHLLSYVGRAAVEDAVRASGHANPSRNEPFLSTREIFAVKLIASQQERDAYVASDAAARRSLLVTHAKRDVSRAMTEAVAWTKPQMIDSIEWFASPEDLCKLMIALKRHADRASTAPVGAILSRNPGLPDEQKAYRYIGFKGGSEPGVVNVTWLLQRARDEKWLFLTLGFNDPSKAIDEEKAIAAATTAREYLAR